MTVSLVVVGYHSSDAVARMLGSREGVDEVVVVDHSEDPEERERLEALPVDRLISQPNLGYAAGLNRGAREADGEVLLLANPDIVLLPGSVEALADAASTPGVGAVGPSLLWDEAGGWRLPQAATTTWRGELTARLAPRRAAHAEHRRQLALWRAARPTSTAVVSGTLMATTRAVFAASGGLDERFFLFFEENDWCRRLGRSGLAVLVVPEARVVHAVGHAVGAAEAEHYPRSHRLYRRLHFPGWYLQLAPEPLAPTIPAGPAAASRPPTAPSELLLSPSPMLVPAVLTRWEGGDWTRGALLPAHARWPELHAATVEGDRVYPLGPVTG